MKIKKPKKPNFRYKKLSDRDAIEMVIDLIFHENINHAYEYFVEISDPNQRGIIYHLCKSRFHFEFNEQDELNEAVSVLLPNEENGHGLIRFIEDVLVVNQIYGYAYQFMKIATPLMSHFNNFDKGLFLVFELIFDHMSIEHLQHERILSDLYSLSFANNEEINQFSKSLIYIQQVFIEKGGLVSDVQNIINHFQLQQN